MDIYIQLYRKYSHAQTLYMTFFMESDVHETDIYCNETQRAARGCIMHMLTGINGLHCGAFKKQTSRMERPNIGFIHFHSSLPRFIPGYMHVLKSVPTIIEVLTRTNKP